MNWKKIILAAIVVALAGVCHAVLMAADTMYWQSNFGPIVLADITVQGGTPEGSSATTLILTADVEISADNSATARLDGPGGDYLVTEYGLEFDRNGTDGSGAGPVAYTPYDSFLSTPVLVTHKKNDDEMVVTLKVRASMPGGDVANVGAYSATQTLTAHWVGP